jgi:two-component system, NarL family, nitrate/nitrite response regulator NarL
MSHEKINIALVDDHQIIIDGLISLLKQHPSINILHTANNGEIMLRQLQQQPVDILLTDVMMPGMSGQQLAKQVKQKFPAIKIIALSMSGQGDIVEEMINEADIAGYVLKQTNAAELAGAITKVYSGGVYFHEDVLKELEAQANIRKEVEAVHITNREKQLIALIEKDLTNKEIAETLCISPLTVETHRKNIFRKTGTNNALSLVKWAYEHKILNKGGMM